MIKPINVITDNVAKELDRIASESNTSTSKLYIELNSVKTFVSDNDADFKEIYAKDISKYTDETLLRDSKTTFNQEYNITVQSVYDGYPFENMICQIVFEENESLAYLIIKKGSKIQYYDALYNDFMNYINEQKLRSNILLYLFDTDYQETIKAFVDVIEKIKKVTFNEDKKILVAEAFDSIESVNAEVSMLVEENKEVKNEESEEKIDYADRGFLLSCVEGEQLFEFIKPQQGQHGRSCKGELIEVETVNLNASPTFTVDNGIEVEDSFENIKYFSKKSGYLVKKGNKYDVENSIDIDQISFKTTGTINSDLNSEISINVIKNNPLEDAIEEGMHVKVQTLNVKGSVGPNTEIEARDIRIDGQTHNESSIKCVNAEIGQHRGKILGRKVEVKTLEGGEIIADIAIVTNALRGIIRAKTIQIGSLGSHVTMEASESITIETLKGEENKFIIDTSMKSPFDENKDASADQEYLKKLKEEFKPLTAKLKETTAKLKKNLEPCEKIKALIIKNKKEGVELSATLLKNFKLCNLMRVHYKKLKDDYEYKKAQIEALKKKLSTAALTPLDVKITIDNPRRSYNTIVYRLNKPQREIELKMTESMMKNVFKLEEDEDGVLRVINTD